MLELTPLGYHNYRKASVREDDDFRRSARAHETVGRAHAASTSVLVNHRVGVDPSLNVD